MLVARQWRRPDEACRPIAQQIHDADGIQIIGCGELGNLLRCAPTVAGLVEPDRNRVAPEVNDIGGARSIDVSQSNAFLVEPTPAGLAAGIQKALAERDEAVRRGLAGRLLIEREYSAARYAQKVRVAYEAVERRLSRRTESPQTP